MKVLCISWVGYLYEPGKLYPIDSKGRVINPSNNYMSASTWDKYPREFVKATDLLIALS
jgi:hypothetical protein